MKMKRLLVSLGVMAGLWIPWVVGHLIVEVVSLDLTTIPVEPYLVRYAIGLESLLLFFVSGIILVMLGDAMRECVHRIKHGAERAGSDE